MGALGALALAAVFYEVFVWGPDRRKAIARVRGEPVEETPTEHRWVVGITGIVLIVMAVCSIVGSCVSLL